MGERERSGETHGMDERERTVRPMRWVRERSGETHEMGEREKW
jgi:hypothetical protein